MFASLFRKHKSVTTIRHGSPRARLGVESLENRTVPSTLLSHLAPISDAAPLFHGLDGGVSGGVLRDGGAGGGAFGNGGAMGGVTWDGSCHTGGVSAGDEPFITRGSGEEIPKLGGSLGAGGVTGGYELLITRSSGEEIPQ